MIASPCRDCPNRWLPKDDCLKSCEILAAVQRYGTRVLPGRRRYESGGIEFTDEYRVALKSAGMSAAE